MKTHSFKSNLYLFRLNAFTRLDRFMFQSIINVFFMPGIVQIWNIFYPLNCSMLTKQWLNVVTWLDTNCDSGSVEKTELIRANSTEQKKNRRKNQLPFQINIIRSIIYNREKSGQIVPPDNNLTGKTNCNKLKTLNIRIEKQNLQQIEKINKTTEIKLTKFHPLAKQIFVVVFLTRFSGR